MSQYSVKPLPLEGKRILVTRTRQQASVLSERLRALGAIPIEFPTIHIVPPQDWKPLDDALKRLCMAETNRPYYTWLVFTSSNGVNMCFERLRSLGLDAEAIGNVRAAAIGPATATTLARYGITADLVPEEYIAEGVAAALIEDERRRGESLQGKRILLARAAEARNILVSMLQQEGAVVDEIAAYRTIAVQSDDERGREVLRLLQARQLDILTFTSSSTVRNFVHWLSSTVGESLAGTLDIETLADARIACIGPITSQTARELGLHVDIEAKEFTIDGLVEAIVQHEEKVWQRQNA
jgi:uroporphyrinogen-III synthase